MAPGLLLILILLLLLLSLLLLLEYRNARNVSDNNTYGEVEPAEARVPAESRVPGESRHADHLAGRVHGTG